MLDTSIATSTNGRRVSFIVNIVTHSLYIVSLPVWYFVSMFSPMLFDAPGSKRYLPVVAFYYALQCYPYMVFIAIVLAWLFYRQENDRMTYPVNASPAVIVSFCTGLMILFGE